jgi:hypothetical protein
MNGDTSTMCNLITVEAIQHTISGGATSPAISPK